ncbi:MAG: high frequency lysogenization protein HflD [Pseudomonadota bacterium]
MISAPDTALSRDQNLTLALAGVLQAANLAQRIARDGIADAEALQQSLASILQTDPPDVPSVFGGVSGVRAGLQFLAHKAARPKADDLEAVQYALTLLQLAGKIRKDPARLDAIGTGIAALATDQENPTLSDEARIETLADIYASHISSLTPRIMVRGNPLYLQNPVIQARVRAVLLAGIRAAILWYQCGGSRLTLLFGRRRLARNAHAFLQAVS